jgi:hypothetical protein
MAIANPRIHVICGLCGCNKEFHYTISKEIDDNTDEEKLVVYVSCKNCCTLTALEELMPEVKKVKQDEPY